MACLGRGALAIVCVLPLLLLHAGVVAAAELPLEVAAELPLGMHAANKAKRQRLLSLVGVGRISDRSLEKVLAAVREDPGIGSTNVSRRELERAQEDVWKSVGVTDELELGGGGTFTWFHSRPSVALNYLIATCTAFSAFFESKLQASPCTPFAPWRIVLYADEGTPGAVLKAANTRKCWVWYFTFLEFGSQHIAKEESWIPFGILR